MKKVMKIIGNAILNILALIAIIVLVISGYVIYRLKIQNKPYATVCGYTALEVVTGSMSGSIEIGDIVIVKITKDVREGDIIVYSNDNNLITHRICKINGETIITKGDANNTEDDPITVNDIIGKVQYTLRNIGIWKDVLSSPLVLTCITITIILFGIAIIYNPKDKEKNMEEKSVKTKKDKIIH